MEYKYIVNPQTNRRCRTDTALGKRIIRNYIKQSGGNPFVGAHQHHETHDVTLSGFSSGAVAKQIADIINDKECGPFSFLGYSGQTLSGKASAKGKQVVLKVKLTDANYGMDYFEENFVDGDNICQGELQELWDNNMGGVQIHY